jgi:outer membrane protein OmpA-like peptidoglycan-associated protein
VHDVDGFWTAVILEPFWVQIPHQTVIFEFGKDTWTEAEIPKLQETLKEIRKAMEQHASKGLEMQLYIAGYTDTVGSAESNMRLSTARARSIGRWFRQNGLDIPIFYQGFGQSVLAVETPDQTEEARNRRAIYVLGNSPPPTSKDIPQANWTRVR